eukprot:jgi/Orpsp1_1/1190374/evm.model.d7180000078573.1
MDIKSESVSSSGSSSSEFDSHRCIRNIIKRYDNPMRHLSMTSSVAIPFVYKDKRLADYKLNISFEKVKNSKNIESINNEASPILKITDNILQSLKYNDSIDNQFHDNEKNTSNNKFDESSSFEDISILLTYPREKKDDIILPLKDKDSESLIHKKNSESKSYNKKDNMKYFDNINRKSYRDQLYSKNISFDTLDSLIKLNTINETESSPPINSNEIIVNNCIINSSFDGDKNKLKYKRINYKEGRKIKKEIELSQRQQFPNINEENIKEDNGKNMKDMIIKNLNNKKYDPIFSDDIYIPSTESSTSNALNSIINSITNQPIDTNSLHDKDIDNKKLISETIMKNANCNDYNNNYNYDNYNNIDNNNASKSVDLS